jgi:hypothetical protein
MLDRWLKGTEGRERAAVRRVYLNTLDGRVPPEFGDILSLAEYVARRRQPGLSAGSLAQCRINSIYLALQIKAIEEGLLPRLAHAMPDATVA